MAKLLAKELLMVSELDHLAAEEVGFEIVFGLLFCLKPLLLTGSLCLE